jgi:hypothetical protein
MKAFEEQTLIRLARIEESLKKSRRRNKQTIEEYPARMFRLETLRARL